MRRFSKALLAPLVAALALTGCGGSAHHPSSGGRKVGSPAVHTSPHAPGWATQAPVGMPLGGPLLSSVPTLEMYDSITVSTVPPNPRAVAGYTSGFWPTFGPLVAAFPHAYHVSIAISGGHVADCLDAEPGDASPGDVAGWVRWMQSLGHKDPCVYSSVSEWGTISSDLSAAGIARASYRKWCAWYRYIPGLVGDCDAVQWSDHALGRNLDESTVKLSFFGIFRKPLPLCFTHRLTAKRCVAVKAQVASDQRAAAASLKVYDSLGGPVIAQRIVWFSKQIKAHPASPKTATRKSALAASRLAWKQRHLGLYLQRYNWFTAQAAQLQQTN